MGKRILVTGGAGFIGASLCRCLLAEGNEILCVDNLSTGALRNIEELFDSDRFKLFRHDISIPIDLEAEEIYNLACPASPVHYQLDPIQTVKSNVMGAINVLELAERLGAKVLQASTSEIYGDPLVHPQTEGYWGNVNPIGPRACYDEGKRCAETLFFDYHRKRNVRIKVIRIFNTYGPYMHPKDGRVVSNFIVQALRDEDITIFGDGEQTRSFCYVDDLVDAMVRMVATGDDVTGPINTGNPVEFTIKDLAEIVIELVGSKSNVVFRQLPVDDPRQRRPDISLARDKLDWHPAVELREGLVKTIEYFEGRIREGAGT